MCMYLIGRLSRIIIILVLINFIIFFLHIIKPMVTNLLHVLQYQLSKAQQKFGDQFLTFNLCCCHGQLASFPVATCRPLRSLAAKCTKFQANIL